MKFRLTGTTQECDRALALLRQVPELVVVSAGHPYFNRGSDTLVRVYVEVEVR